MYIYFDRVLTIPSNQVHNFLCPKLDTTQVIQTVRHEIQYWRMSLAPVVSSVLTVFCFFIPILFFLVFCIFFSSVLFLPVRIPSPFFPLYVFYFAYWAIFPSSYLGGCLGRKFTALTDVWSRVMPWSTYVTRRIQRSHPRPPTHLIYRSRIVHINCSN